MSLEDVVEGIYLEVLSSHGKVVGDWIELYTVDGLFQLKSLNCLVSSVVYHIKPAFLPSRKDVIALAGNSVNIRLMKVFNLLTEAADSQVPYSNFTILTS